MDYKDMDLQDGNIFSKRKMKKALAPEGVHVPNKNEAKLLRKIMSETGLSEKEIREHKTYRIQLSNVQKVVKSKLTSEERVKIRVMKSITKKLKLAKEHPLVVEAFNKEWEKIKNNR